jgi:selenide,water dikinase
MQVLRQLPTPAVKDPNILIGFSTSDDAAIYRVTDDIALVLTVDFFPPIVDDPEPYGAIAAANALSDVYAMGGRPVTALNVAGVPNDLPHEIFGRILKGGAEKAAEAGITVSGGHTVTDEEPKYGMAVTGFVHPDKFITNANAQAGDKLVLTKPIGTGIISTAGKAQEVDEETLSNATRVMATLNKGASEAMLAIGVNAATDITGYGLVGHVLEMASGSGAGITLSRSAVPILPGAKALLKRGIVPGGTHRNLAGTTGKVDWAAGLSSDDQLMMCDAQTSGGLLISVAPDRCDDLVAALNDADTPCAAVIGEVTADSPGRINMNA